MPERAHLTSVEALESFRSSLIIYLSKARPAVEEVSSEVHRTRAWLQEEQRMRWETQMRRRARQLEQAQQALFGAKLSNPRGAPDAEQMAVRKAKRAMEEAETKLRRVKQWTREFDSQIEPSAKQLNRLVTFLTMDMPKSVAYLGQAVKTLADYAGVTPSQAYAESGQSDPAAEGKSSESESGAHDQAEPDDAPGGTP